MPHLPPLRLLLKRRIQHVIQGCAAFLLTRLGMQQLRGEQPFAPDRPTVVVVSHEASITGAPVLALNLCQQLNRSHNVVVILLRGGPLQRHFQAQGTALIQPRRQVVNRALVRRALARACRGRKPAFALVNTVVSAPLLEPLRSEGIACLCLLHEFVSYIKPLDVFSEAALWSSRVVCSTPLTWKDVLRHCSHLADVPVVVLPQGRCEPPSASEPAAQRTPTSPPQGDAARFLKQLPDRSLLVVGAGAVHPRKGIDLFVAVADQISRRAPELPVQFAWIGSGYDPEHDFSVSVWLRDQIERSGLSDRLTMLEASPDYSALIERCDLFVVSSRLDPLPNVGIDAMLSGTPVLCFAEACGIADLLERQPELHAACVAPYVDCSAMAGKALALLRSPERLRELGAISRAQARRWFDMPSYIEALLQLADSSRQDIRQETGDLHRLREQQLLDLGFCFPGQRLSDQHLYERYLLSWRNNIWARKPFPGFHPGIYRERQLPAGSRRDPLAHWDAQGRPAGPWLLPVIEPSAVASPLPESGQVALHLHVYYPELLAPILQGLAHNRVQPDLFISFSDPALERSIRQTLEAHQRRASLHPVPNRGRDIGPLLSELGEHLDRNYAFHGHLHTKKSVLVDAETSGHWRRFLLMNLLGDARRPMADRILAAMQRQPDLGLVFPDDPGCLGWTENRQEAEALAERLGLPSLPTAINFPVGTMFWARRGALRQLYQLGLTWEDYPAEPVGHDGTMLHAIERLLPQICLASGLRYALTHRPGYSR